ncbi:hypothetical protein HQ47_07045 [Porphyromonas macacae]|uniref:Uncharacterized protein n=1 Tax=Porphyromonas macacae TaxID=28115 RepID=A0A0A2EB80_9PORP|nr:hypothetical protein [Porphyromonas macacae]KGN73694.1 hypothetical protein HQ47_07045 [Porphyromonas macacae]
MFIRKVCLSLKIEADFLFLYRIQNLIDTNCYTDRENRQYVLPPVGHTARGKHQLAGHQVIELAAGYIGQSRRQQLFWQVPFTRFFTPKRRKKKITEKDFNKQEQNERTHLTHGL